MYVQVQPFGIKIPNHLVTHYTLNNSFWKGPCACISIIHWSNGLNNLQYNFKCDIFRSNDFSGLHDSYYVDFSKLYLLLGICGSVGDITSRYLERTGKYAEFRSRLEWLYNLTFADGIIGEDIDFVLPNAELLQNYNVAPPFTGCTGSFWNDLSLPRQYLSLQYKTDFC